MAKPKAARQGDFIKELAQPALRAATKAAFTWAEDVSRGTPPPSGMAKPQFNRLQGLPPAKPSDIPKNSRGQPDLKRIRARLERRGRKG